MSDEAVKKVREVLADAYSFVRSMEANASFATVTIEELMGDQIKRNGESSASNASQYDPYNYNTKKTSPASAEEAKRANFLGGSDLLRPTKLDRVLAIQNSLNSLISDLKKSEPADVGEFVASAENGIESEESGLQWLYKLK